MVKLGKHDGFKIHCPYGLAGSIPASGTTAGQRVWACTDRVRSISDHGSWRRPVEPPWLLGRRQSHLGGRANLTGSGYDDPLAAAFSSAGQPSAGNVVAGSTATTYSRCAQGASAVWWISCHSQACGKTDPGQRTVVARPRSRLNQVLLHSTAWCSSVRLGRLRRRSTSAALPVCLPGRDGQGHRPKIPPKSQSLSWATACLEPGSLERGPRHREPTRDTRPPHGSRRW